MHEHDIKSLFIQKHFTNDIKTWYEHAFTVGFFFPSLSQVNAKVQLRSLTQYYAWNHNIIALTDYIQLLWTDLKDFARLCILS